MAYCGPRSIPYRHWLGGPPVWDDLSRDSALAWDRFESARHTGPGQCGQHPEMWRDPETGEELDEADLPLIPAERFCRGCEMLQRHESSAGGEDGRLPAGVHLAWTVPPPASPDEDDEP